MYVPLGDVPTSRDVFGRLMPPKSAAASSGSSSSSSSAATSAAPVSAAAAAAADKTVFSPAFYLGAGDYLTDDQKMMLGFVEEQVVSANMHADADALAGYYPYAGGFL